MFKSLVLLLLLAALASGVVAIRPAFAAAIGGGERVRAALIADASMVEPGQTFPIALSLDIADGWHTYWRNPGDSGEPTRIDWDLPAGVEASEIQWPAPERIPYGPLVNFGYHGRALHLIDISVPAEWPLGRPLKLRATASWLVCKDICIPEQAELSLALPVGDGGSSGSAAGGTIAAARAQLPVDFAGNARFTVQPSGGRDGGAQSGEALILRLDDAETFASIGSAYFFPHTWGAVDTVAPQRVEKGDDGLRLTMLGGSQPPGDRLAGVLVVNPEAARDDPARRAVAIDAERDASVAGAVPIAGETAARAFGTVAGGGANPGLFAALGLALLGGLLLNIMPCVFPVLSMKAMGVIRHASDRRALRISGVSYAAGVLAFVGLVAALLIGLKAAGEEIGWGFQLQSPAFVAAMALVVFGLGLSLSGVFAVGAIAMGWGSGLAAERSGPLGSFLTGALAALVATPCTAPFMGIALGFALTQPWPVALSVFLVLGLGLALPYLVLTLVPGLAAWLPRPGTWMDRVKQFLAFPLYLTAAWLVWVLSLQAGAGAVLAVLVAMILVAFAAWLFEMRHGFEAGGRRVAGMASLAVGAAAFVLAVWPQTGAAPLPHDGSATSAVAPGAAGGPPFEPFSPARLDGLRSEGIPTFVNFTAAWCITCQVNERLALSSHRVAEAFRARGIVYLKGDWTNRDPEIARLLESFGRSGVPLYLMFQPGRDQPVILPQLLTETIVLDAVEAVPRVASDGNALKGKG